LRTDRARSVLTYPLAKTSSAKLIEHRGHALRIGLHPHWWRGRTRRVRLGHWSGRGRRGIHLRHRHRTRHLRWCVAVRTQLRSRCARHLIRHVSHRWRLHARSLHRQRHRAVLRTHWSTELGASDCPTQSAKTLRQIRARCSWGDPRGGCGCAAVRGWWSSWLEPGSHSYAHDSILLP